MESDPIITEVRKAGEELAAQANGDLHRFFEHLRSAQEQYGDRLVKEVPRLSPGMESTKR